jgi:hypothetical protein
VIRCIRVLLPDWFCPTRPYVRPASNLPRVKQLGDEEHARGPPRMRQIRRPRRPARNRWRAGRHPDKRSAGRRPAATGRDAALYAQSQCALEAAASAAADQLRGRHMAQSLQFELPGGNIEEDSAVLSGSGVSSAPGRTRQKERERQRDAHLLLPPEEADVQKVVEQRCGKATLLSGALIYPHLQSRARQEQ